METQMLTNHLENIEGQIQDLAQNYSHHANTRTNLHRVQLPKFNKCNPQLWFAQLERVFRLNTISDDTDKFDLIVISLDEDVILDIEDLVAAPPQQDRYETLKARLLKKYAQTTEKKIQRLLQAKEMTGMKPTEMLAHMRRLAPSSLEPVIRSIFLQNIPSSIRPLLSAWPEDDLDNLAEVADKMLDAAKMDDVHISQQSTQLPAGSSVDAISRSGNMEKTLQKLIDSVNNLQTQFNKIKSSPRSQNSKQQIDNSNAEDELCYFHKRFGNDARKCRTGCSKWQDPK
ncbi:hypothetical protein ACLKA7_001178 [Drosophila subpalustris]